LGAGAGGAADGIIPGKQAICLGVVSLFFRKFYWGCQSLLD